MLSKKTFACRIGFVASIFLLTVQIARLGSGGAGTLPGTAGAAPGSTNPGDRGLVVFKF